jgi:ubiquinone/menaquinone biosynthesis C-methylase UbiE
MAPGTEDAVERYYGQTGLAERLLAALRAAGLDPDALTAEDLAPVEEFHVRGREATAELAELLELRPDLNVLDVGCGIGGPARYLARRFGCRVTGVDLTAELVRTAALLTERVGLAERVSFRAANALDLPFDDASFDLVWTQHAAMNIAERPRLYAEMARVLRAGGCLVAYDIVAGSGEPLHFPVPWADTSEISHLVTAETMRSLLEAAGFTVQIWRDVRSLGRDWARARAERLAAAEPGPLGPQLSMGPDWRAKIGNLARNLTEGRIGLVQALLDGPS